jgi:hypothetical protein
MHAPAVESRETAVDDIRQRILDPSQEVQTDRLRTV